jgi:hypothetical protein
MDHSVFFKYLHRLFNRQSSLPDLVFERERSEVVYDCRSNLLTDTDSNFRQAASPSSRIRILKRLIWRTLRHGSSAALAHATSP